jgi:hypothetical protein
MRGSIATVAVTAAALAACGEVQTGSPDAPPGLDAAETDAPADAATCPKTLLNGGAMVEPQGWTPIIQAPANLTYGPDYVRLDTSTVMGATTSGQLLLQYPGALPQPPFRLQVVLLVERVNTHNQFDAGAAIMASFSGGFGNGTDRGQMIYLDAGRVGWADDMQSFTASITNNAFHTIELAVDASNVAQVKVDGIAALTRTGFATNGAIAIGDQTNDASVDGAIRIRSVTLLCPWRRP